MREDAALIVDDIAGTDHGARAAGETFIREDEGAVFRHLDRTGGTGFFAQPAADAAYLAGVFAAGVLVRAEDDDGVILQAQVNDTLRTGEVARAAADALALIDLGNAVAVQRDRTEMTGVNTGAAARAAIGAEIVALGGLLGAAAAVAVDAGDLRREFLFDDLKNLPFCTITCGCWAYRLRGDCSVARRPNDNTRRQWRERSESR